MKKGRLIRRPAPRRKPLRKDNRPPPAEGEKTPERKLVEGLHDYAGLLGREGKWSTAEAAARRGLGIDPKCPELWAVLGGILWTVGAFEEAVKAIEHAIELVPDCGEYWGSLALVRHAQRDYVEAERCFAEAIHLSEAAVCGITTPEAKEKLKAELLTTRFNRSVMRIELGKWDLAWPEYENRIESMGKLLYPGIPNAQMWKGEPLDGKTIYVQQEQGLGDRVLFSRYFAEMKARWPTCRIIAQVNPYLHALFWEFRELVELIPNEVPWPEGIDYAVFQASLPCWLGSQPDAIPPDPGIIKRRVQRDFDLGRAKGLPETIIQPSLRIGVAWTGNPEQSRNHLRSIPLSYLLSLAENPHVMLYSLQVGAGSENIAELGAKNLVIDLGAEIAKANYSLVLGGCAMMALDLVISVCTGTAHLAGALDVPTWTLLSWNPYWVWMQTERSPRRTPWYPSMRLFRQPESNDWESVIAAVKGELAKITDQICRGVPKDVAVRNSFSNIV